MRIAYALLAAVGAPSPLRGTPKCLLVSTYYIPTGDSPNVADGKRKPIKEKKQKKIKKKFLSFFLFHNIEKMRK